jgi:hypothetical protein
VRKIRTLPYKPALLRVLQLKNVVSDAFCIRCIKRQAATAVLFASPRAPASSHKVPETSTCVFNTLLQRDLRFYRLTATLLNRLRASSTCLPPTTFHRLPLPPSAGRSQLASRSPPVSNSLISFRMSPALCHCSPWWSQAAAASSLFLPRPPSASILVAQRVIMPVSLQFFVSLYLPLRACNKMCPCQHMFFSESPSLMLCCSSARAAGASAEDFAAK